MADYREGGCVRAHGCRKLAAANLRGTGRIARDFAWELYARLLDGTYVTVRVRFAGLAASRQAPIRASNSRLSRDALRRGAPGPRASGRRAQTAHIYPSKESRA